VTHITRSPSKPVRLMKFTRHDLNQLLDRLDQPDTATPLRQAA